MLSSISCNNFDKIKTRLSVTKIKELLRYVNNLKDLMKLLILIKMFLKIQMLSYKSKILISLSKNIYLKKKEKNFKSKD